MDTLIIQVNCKLPDRIGPPQLGITVEAPYSVALQQRQQQQAKDYRNHDYQNFHMPNVNLNYKNSNKPNQKEPKSINPSASQKQSISSIGEHTQRGLQVTNIQQGSVIDQNGQFRIGDIIVEVNGINLQRRSFQDAQKTLREFVVKQSSHGPLLLKVLRKAASSSSLPSTTGSQATVIERNNNSQIMSSSSTATSPKKSSSNSASTPSPHSSASARHFVGALNTRRIGTRYRIRLTKSNEGGFGIKIAERDNMFGLNRPIYITAITTTGPAYRDGRLKEGDMLLEIDGIDLSEKSQPEVTKMLKGVCVNQSVEFIVSRQETNHIDECNQISGGHNDLENKKSTENGCDNNTTSLIDLEVADQDDFVFSESNDHQLEQKIDSILNVPNEDEFYVFDIPLNDTKSAGLGLYLKYPALKDKDLGIWIANVITGGAAWKDGRLKPNDQILAINGISLLSLSNNEASKTLKAAVLRGKGPEALTNTIRLNIHRRDPSVVDKILQGTNHRIELSDLSVNGNNISYISDKTTDNTQESYRTAFDSTMHNRSQSSNDTSNSTKSSNQNSHNDSAMSPQTQASNSLKLSSSCIDRSEQNSSDKTNDTSSAISQITDFTTVPIIENVSTENKIISSNSDQAAFTLPKTLELTEGVQNLDPASGTQSWDDESIEATGEERFQRDGFGRRSISEKKHASLMAKNTDTFKRNQKIREEIFRQRQLEEQLERQRLDDSKRQSLDLINTHVIRNRKINESFRVAVDRSYHTLGGFDYPCNEQLRSSTTTSNDERSLINNSNGFANTYNDHNSNSYGSNNLNRNNHISVKKLNDLNHNRNHNININNNHNSDNNYSSNNSDSINTNGNSKPISNNSTGHKKSSSLLTRFLKFGSMKKSKKKSNDNQTGVKSSESKSASTETQTRESSSDRQEPPINQMTAVHHQHPHRSSMHMYQYQPVHNLQAQNHIHQHSLSHSKLAQNVMSEQTKPMMNNHNYSLHQQGPPLPPSNHSQHHHHQIPIDMHNLPIQIQQAPRNLVLQNSHIGPPNGLHQSPNQWHPQPIQAPNGLWVANSPHIHTQNVYGATNQHVHNQQPTVTMPHPTPFLPTINAPHNPNGIINHPAMFQGHAPHNQQPQHIYYYDF